jgi:hypothetical protein
MSTEMLAMLIGATAALFLAVRGLQSQSLSFERKAWMAVVWAVIIAVLAFVIQRFAA